MSIDDDRCEGCNHLRKHHHDGGCDATGPIFRDYCYCKEFVQPGMSDGCGVALVQTSKSYGVFRTPDACPEPCEVTHRAFPTDAQALAKMRDEATVAAATQMVANRTPGEVVEAVFRVLFGDA